MLHDGYIAVANVAVGYTAAGLLGPVIRSIFNRSVEEVILHFWSCFGL